MADILDLIQKDLIWIALGFVLLFIRIGFRERINKGELFNLKYDNFFKTILFPAIVIFIFLVAFRLISGTAIEPENIPLGFAIASFIIIIPFFEELFLRGVILGGAMDISSKINIKFFEVLILGLGFIIQLGISVWIYGTFTNMGIAFSAVGGLIYSALFMFYKKDLFAPVIAHAAANFFIMISLFA